MKALILYGSEYGTAKKYAEKFSEMMHFPVKSYEAAADLEEYELLIYFGGLYAGGMKGLKKLAPRLPKNIKLILVTVGLADVSDKRNTENIRNSIKKQTPEIYGKSVGIFHLRGAIDYERLNFKHQAMMTLLYHKTKRIPEERRTSEEREMIDTFHSKVDFVDFRSLIQIREAVMQLSLKKA